MFVVFVVVALGGGFRDVYNNLSNCALNFMIFLYACYIHFSMKKV